MRRANWCSRRIAEFERVKGFGAIEGGKQTLDRLAEWLARG
jgi:hypothetical protein